MTSLFIAAFLMGSIGSVHCIGMCGPLALSLPLANNDNWSRFTAALLYNSGRMVTYSILGAIFGIIGMSFALFGIQQWLSIILGILILLFMVLPRGNFAKKNVAIQFFELLRSRLGNLFHRKNFRTVFFIGLLNGLLPCGLIYIAIAAAISTGSVAKSSLFMAFFALGTFPVMWSIAYFGSYISSGMRQGIKKCYPYLMFLMAVLLILRGSGLEIPYVSPLLHHHTVNSRTAIECHH